MLGRFRLVVAIFSHFVLTLSADAENVLNLINIDEQRTRLHFKEPEACRAARSPHQKTIVLLNNIRVSIPQPLC